MQYLLTEEERRFISAIRSPGNRRMVEAILMNEDHHNDMRTFFYGGHQVRTVMCNGEPWWVLADVCNVLELSTPARVSERLDDDEKGVSFTHTLGGRQKTTIINEPGLYSVVLRSNKPQAKNFKRWIVHEVLPSIRKTGAYRVNQSTVFDHPHLTVETQWINATVSKAQLLCKIAEEYNGKIRQALQDHATKALTGEFLLSVK